MENIKSPRDLDKLNDKQLNELCCEIRECMLKVVAENGGHLASNLGVVELTVALHRAFNSPDDSIIFDVGHQCYTHKLLTGRYAEFPSLRTENGISGFMKPSESEHDPIITGHSSSSVSAGYGICKGNMLDGRSDYVVVVIGDGALTGGMVYEAFNSIGRDKCNLILVLNDNGMSISRNVGALSRQLNLIRNKISYHRFKHAIENMVLRIPYIGKKLRGGLLRSKNMLKNAIYNSNIFEGLGLKYLGPVNGHNISQLTNMFEIAKNSNRPVVIHTITKKGKGYPFAESNPDVFHGISPFDIVTGNKLSVKQSDFSHVFGEQLCKIAESDTKVCAITASMTAGTGLEDFAAGYSNRFFDVGIAEEHAVTFAAGLAKSGQKPVFAVYSSFLQRGYDQVLHDAAIANLPVTLCIDRAGIVGEDGETHQGLFDVAFLSTVPNVKIFAPSNYNELKKMLSERLSNPVGVAAIRYPRGSEPEYIKNLDYSGGEFDVIGSGEVAVVVYGTMFAEAAKAADILADRGIEISIIKLNLINELSDTLLNNLLMHNKIYFFEEGIVNGGIAQQLGLKLLDADFKGKYKTVGINGFVQQASISAVRSRYGLDVFSIVDLISGEWQ